MSANLDHMKFDMRAKGGPADATNLCKQANAKESQVGIEGTCVPEDIIAIWKKSCDGPCQPDKRVESLISSFSTLTKEYTDIELAESFAGDFNTIAVRSK